MRTHWRPAAPFRMKWLVLPLALAGVLGCAVSVPPGGLPPSQPAARLALRPEYRVFHDALQDYGDWILIEPHGFVFRPRVNFESWRPYTSGFWTPTDVYGWVWVSDEPFGWATFHYGNWLQDDYEGWVWIPGVDWGPSWVTWSTSGDYVGWAPLGPSGFGVSIGGLTNWVAASNLGATNLERFVVDASEVGGAASSARPANNTVDVEGVRVNTGPSFSWVEQRTGPLRIAKLEDLVTPGVADAPATGGAEPGANLPGLADRAAAPLPSASVTQRAAVRAAREAQLARKDGAITRVPVVRPFGVTTMRGAVIRAQPDSTR